MNIINYLLLSIAVVLNKVRAQPGFYYENENDNYEKGFKPFNGKVYFPGETNENEVNLKRLNNTKPNSFISDTHTNYLEDENGKQPSISAKRNTLSVLKTIRDIIPTNQPTIVNININIIDDQNSPSFMKRVVDKKRYSSAESDEEISKSSTSGRRNSNQPSKRIPPPSVMSSVAGRSNLRVCEIKYAEYIQRIFPQESDTARDANDAEFNGRILAAPGEYPHMTALGFASKNDTVDYRCGGSLISEHFVITAAHCANFSGLQPTKVRIGDLNLMIEESYLEPQIRDIKKIYIHPDYRARSYYNDIALLELAEEVELTEFVRPIRLWTQPTFPFTTAYAMGYGATDFARERTNRLTNLNMTIVSNDDCIIEMPKLPETERGILSSQICARDFALNRDTCQGDSGGPLQLNIRGRRRTNRLHYQLIGITSYGLFCRSGYPSIFTRVYSYLDWIEHIVWKDYFD